MLLSEKGGGEPTVTGAANCTNVGFCSTAKNDRFRRVGSMGAILSFKSLHQELEYISR